MKKISLLLVLIMCVTIGGVYAAWTYTGSTVSSVDRTISHGMSTATTDGDVGMLEIVSNNVDVKIDQMADKDYRANLVITGEVVVRFTPNAGAPDEVVNNAIHAHAKLYTKNAESNMYQGAPIYVSPADSYIELQWEKQDNGTFLATVTAAEIDTLLDLGGSFVLDTHAEYLDFHALEENITLTLQFAQS